MSDIITSLESIILPYVPACDRGSINLSDYRSEYRRNYFDYIPFEAAKDALELFPNSEGLLEKYNKINEYYNDPFCLNDEELCDVVLKYLKSSALIMTDECLGAKKFIEEVQSIRVSKTKPCFEPVVNKLHSSVYNTIQDFLLDELPEGKEYWVLYDWSLNKTKWATASAYFLSGYLDNKAIEGTDLFESAFELWASNNSNNYWAGDNSYSSQTVYVLGRS